ncbi:MULTISPECIES: hypothetical protein [unclassified Microcoleus]|uniref:hypothetical protein n=1 Tax=unclassified Microcoleus TaxID=2642155 RepID=UPI002FD220E8
MDEEDAEEQQETGEYLIHALDEDRLSDRQLFPIELKGVILILKTHATVSVGCVATCHSQRRATIDERRTLLSLYERKQTKHSSLLQ